VRNCENSLKEVVNSLFDQDFPHGLMEVIFVDDGSEDRTMSVILDSVSGMDMWVKVHHQEWKGLGPVRNFVVNNAGGDYIIWVDGDMVLSRDHVRKQVEFMDQNPTVGIAKGKYGIYPGAKLVAILENADFIVDDKWRGKKTSKPLGTGGSIYRVKAIRQVGGFDNHIKGAGEDMDAEHRVRGAGWLLCLTPSVFFERHKETWKALWTQYFLRGYSLHRFLHKWRGIISLYKMTPPIGFVAGILYSFPAYKLTCRKVVFLLPLHYVFKMTAWCLGFTKGHIDGYGHA